jgi:hypothetical protein
VNKTPSKASTSQHSTAHSTFRLDIYISVFYESNNEVDVSIIFLNCLIRKIFTMGPRWVEILRKSLTSGSIKELRPRFLSTYFI